ncbi:MAG: tetratricopeptide (TPR) repeat protein [Dokdonia sp.]|jgi:tetratricopeptide (TPR) repeat protein
MKINSSICVIALGVCISCIAFSCDSKKGHLAFDYGTKNDSALFYFYKGWEHIMDKGEWTLSEEAFRKAVDHDPDFLIGKSLVGRISDDLEERLEIKEVLESKKETLTADERLLLDVYMLNIDLTNARSQSPESLGAIVKDFRALSETNYRTFVHTYPEESYIKAEYIEVLHAGYGPQLALDSLQILTSQKEREEHLFFKSYSASLEAELGNYEQALLYANQVLTMSKNASIANPQAVFADIYFKMDSLQLAKMYIEKAVALDPKHIIAQGLKSNIEKSIKDTL